MRTNIDIDDELMREAMAATSTTTKKAAVEASMRLAVQLKAQEGIGKWFGKIVWRGHDDDWFASDEEILQKRRAEQDRGAASPRPSATKQPATPMEPR
jgi:Bacterial antitoxin of type II TA system, VapB